MSHRKATNCSWNRLTSPFFKSGPCNRESLSECSLHFQRLTRWSTLCPFGTIFFSGLRRWAAASLLFGSFRESSRKGSGISYGNRPSNGSLGLPFSTTFHPHKMLFHRLMTFAKVLSHHSINYVRWEFLLTAIVSPLWFDFVDQYSVASSESISQPRSVFWPQDLLWTGDHVDLRRVNNCTRSGVLRLELEEAGLRFARDASIFWIHLV